MITFATYFGISLIVQSTPLLQFSDRDTGAEMILGSVSQLRMLENRLVYILDTVDPDLLGSQLKSHAACELIHSGLRYVVREHSGEL